MSNVVIHSDIGQHNSKLPVSAARLLEGGSWKRQRVITIIPAGKSIPTKVYLSHKNLIHPPNQSVATFDKPPDAWYFNVATQNMEVGHAYSDAIAFVLEHPELSTWEYILTLEADNMPPADGLVKLIRRMEQHPEFACIGGLYWTKGEGGVPQIWGDPRDPVPNSRPQAPVPGQLVECCGTGMGFNLWRLSMFKDPKLRRPWFKTIAGPEGYMTQDLYFWADARKNGYRCAVDCDVLVGHFDERTGVCW